MNQAVKRKTMDKRHAMEWDFLFTQWVYVKANVQVNLVIQFLILN